MTQIADGTVRNAVIGISLLLATFSGGFAQDRPSPPPVGPVTSVGQKDGVTAGVVVYEAPKPNPVRQRLSAALVSHHSQMSQALAQQNGAHSVYLYLLDNEDPEMRGRRGEPKAFLFLVEWSSSIEPQYGAVGCPVAEGAMIRGWSGYLSDGVSRRFFIDPISNPENPVLRALCRGLGTEASSLPDTGGPATMDAGLTVFEYLSKGMPFAAFLLLPGREHGQLYEETDVRYRWVSAVRPLYLDTADLMERLQNPSTFQQLAALELGQPVSVPLDIPYDYWSIPTNEPYPEQAVADLGADLQEMDSVWLSFISSAAVTIRGRRFRLSRDGRTQQVVPAFGLQELGTPDFWAAHGDLMSLNQQMNCIGARFLLQHGYAAGNEIPGGGSCPLYRMTAPAG